MENRNGFITLQCAKSYGEYARSQIHRAKGKNKKVHNPQPADPPSKLEFCKVINVKKMIDCYADPVFLSRLLGKKNFMPCRPVDLSETDVDLSQFRASKVEGTRNVYRLYKWGDEANGVFRGSHENLVVDSISPEDEWEKFWGLLIYNEDAYRKHRKKWKEYWTWIRERNPARWGDQESGNIGFDAKHMSHCIRLNLECKHILEEGHPLVRLPDGKERDDVLDIKLGKWKWDDIISWCDDLTEEIKELRKKSTLPDRADDTWVEMLLAEIHDHIRKNYK